MSRLRKSTWACAVAVGLLARPGLPDTDSLPWQPPGSVPLPKQFRSVEFPRHDEPLYVSPGGSERRGAARLGARLPIFAVAPAAGQCQNHWFMVGASAWVCEDHIRLSRWEAIAANQHDTFPDGLPYAYYFISPDGTFGYASLDLAEEAIPDSQLEPGFAVGIRLTQRKPGGELYGLSTHNLWLPMRDLRPVTPSAFKGIQLKSGEKHLAWVLKDNPPVYSAPGRVLSISQRPTLARWTSFSVQQTSQLHSIEYVKVAERQWLRSSDVRRMTETSLPSSVGAQERWLDIDTAQQVLTAYVGQSPVFATLVSTGRGADGTAQATPKGEHRIWVKLLSTDMTNLENESASRYYAIEDVPYVMFFKGGYGLHGAFWHQSFGTRRSHGCVNLSPLDAQFLFHWTGPRLPAGFHAVLPTPHDAGTRIVVR